MTRQRSKRWRMEFSSKWIARAMAPWCKARDLPAGDAALVALMFMPPANEFLRWRIEQL